jgi:type IV secretion system protein VirB2
MKFLSQKDTQIVWRVTFAVVAAVAVATLPEIAEAATTLTGANPWEGPIDRLSNSLQGPVAKAVGAASIAGAGLTLAMGESGGLMRKAGGVATGGAVAFNAASWGLPFLGYSGAVTF